MTTNNKNDTVSQILAYNHKVKIVMARKVTFQMNSDTVISNDAKFCTMTSPVVYM
jgi:hypothetical protein